MTLNLLKPILSLFSGKYFIEMKESRPPTRAQPLLLFQEAHLEELFYTSYFFSLYLFHLSNFLPTYLHLFIVGVPFLRFILLAPELEVSILWNLDKCVPSPGFVFVPRPVNTKPISPPSQRLYL